MPKQRVEEENFPKLFMFTSACNEKRNASSAPNKSETNDRISNLLPPLRCVLVLLSALDTLHSSLRTRTPSLPFLPSLMRLFSNGKNRETLLRKRTLLWEPPCNLYGLIMSYCSDFSVYCFICWSGVNKIRIALFQYSRFTLTHIYTSICLKTFVFSCTVYLKSKYDKFILGHNSNLKSKV